MQALLGTHSDSTKLITNFQQQSLIDENFTDPKHTVFALNGFSHFLYLHCIILLSINEIKQWIGGFIVNNWFED